MSVVRLSIFLSASLLLVACGPDMKDAIRVNAFSADPTQLDTMGPEQMQDAARRGLVIAYAKGDVIDLSLHLQSDLVQTAPIEPIQLEVKQPIWLYSGGSGIYLSTDGASFRPWRELIDGSFQFGVGLNGSTKQNMASIELRGNIAD